MRTFALAFLPVITAVIGYLFSLKYNEAENFWNKFLYWHKKIKTEISFSQNSLPEILRSDAENDKFLNAALDFINKKENVPKFKFLSNEENDFLNKYLQDLGTTDKNSQIDFLNSMEQDLIRYAKDSENKSKKYRPLFIKLGFLFGLIIFILVV